MYISARARPHDGSNFHRDGAGVHRGVAVLVSSLLVVAHDHVPGRHTFIILFSCLCATAIRLR
jgi:hypothetical protein